MPDHMDSAFQSLLAAKDAEIERLHVELEHRPHNITVQAKDVLIEQLRSRLSAAEKVVEAARKWRRSRIVITPEGWLYSESLLEAAIDELDKQKEDSK